MEDAIQLLNNWGPGRIGKIEILPILPICLSAHPKQYGFQFSISQQSLGRSGNRQIPDHPWLSQQLKTTTKDAKEIPNETTGHPALEAHYAKFTSCVTGKSLLTLFASLTYAFHYLMTLIKQKL